MIEGEKQVNKKTSRKLRKASARFKSTKGIKADRRL